MTVSIAVSFSGTIFAARIAFKIVNRDGNYLYPAILAALFAGFGMYGIQDNINGTLDPYLHYLLSHQSDTMIVSLMLAAVDFHMQGKRRLTMLMLLLGGMGRPEDWPILFLYSGWCWCYRRDLRWYIAGIWLVLLFAWFGVPGITNGRPFVAYQLAQDSPRAITGGKVGGTVLRFTALNLWPVWVLALIALGWSAGRGRPATGTGRLGDLLAPPRPLAAARQRAAAGRAALRPGADHRVGVLHRPVGSGGGRVRAAGNAGGAAIPVRAGRRFGAAGGDRSRLAGPRAARAAAHTVAGRHRGRRRVAGVPDPRPAHPRPDRAQGPRRAEGPHAPVQRARRASSRRSAATRRFATAAPR